MNVLLRQFRDEPAVAISVLVALLSAAVAAGSVVASGGATLVAVLAGVAALQTALLGGSAIRAKVVPLAPLVEMADDQVAMRSSEELHDDTGVNVA